jgi:hypothetical protein
MDAESDVPTGMPEEEPESPPLGVPADDDDPDVAELPGIPDGSEPPSSG